MTITTATAYCGTCGRVHSPSPFGGCPAWDEPLFDNLTRAELDTLTGKLAGAALEAEAEADALARMDRRARASWPGGFARALYGVDAGTYTALAADTSWLLSDALGALEVRA